MGGYDANLLQFLLIKPQTPIEDKFFTPHRIYFIGNLQHINKLWILEKPLLKPKRAHIRKMMLKPMVQNP